MTHPLILRCLHCCNELVDEVYALGAKWEEEDDARMRSFAEARARAAVHFTSSLYLTAWRISEGLRLPEWLER